MKMNIAKIGIPVLLSRISSCFVPVFVGWDLTRRCNLNCLYCRVPEEPVGEELSTAEVCQGIENLSQAGTVRIHFGGGAVPLREKKEV